MQHDDIERVLKAAGPREKPPAEMERALREALRQEWRAVVAEHRTRRRRLAFALAAGVAAAAVGVWTVLPRLEAPGATVGTIALASGELRVRSGWLGRWVAAGPGSPLLTGQVLATGPAGRGALVLAGGVSARLDQATRVRVAAADRLVIDRGALYVDAGTGAARTQSLEIVTPAGSVRHLGTQYEVRLLPAGVRLRVREGRIEWHSGAGTAAGRAGEQLTISPQGIARGAVATHGEDWDWVAAAAPAIDIEGLPLTGFLAWAARELGCRLEFASPAVEQEAAAVRLHGSIAGLTPAEALAAVFATTRMHAAVADGVIQVTAQD